MVYCIHRSHPHPVSGGGSRACVVAACPSAGWRSPQELLTSRRVAARKVQTLRARLIDSALWALTAGLALTTLLFSLGFSPPDAGALPLADKFGHGLMYFATYFCFLLAAVWRPGRGEGSIHGRGLFITLGVVAAGVAIEALQEFATKDRHAQLGDVLAETIGAFGAFAIHAWVRRAEGSSPR